MKEDGCRLEDFRLCPKFEQAFAILGKRWNGLIIDVLLLEGPQRFGILAAKIPSLSDRVLVERLKELELNGIVSRNEDEINCKKVIYQLTEKGQELEPVMREVQKWAEKWVVLQEES